MKKEKREKSPIFKAMVDHIDETWFRLKTIHYPFQGRDFRDLKSLCGSFQEWGVMALWDVFLAADNDWVRKSGYSIGAFMKCVPWLVDDRNWRNQAKAYEAKIAPAYPANVLDLFDMSKVAVHQK